MSEYINVEEINSGSPEKYSSTMMKNEEIEMQDPEKNYCPSLEYLKSPEIIKVQPEDFKDIVQLLTGNHALFLNPSSEDLYETGF